MKSKTVRHLFCRSAFAACLVGVAVAFPSCEDENLTGQPSWLGNSIYERLQEMGNYKTTLKLIDELEQTEVLSHTGSKTLFVADDAAFEEWFKTNDWGARNYGQLTTAQKKLLLNGSMINNAYLVELLSNVSGNPPQSGLCMRRATSQTLYDSVYKIKPAEMPSGAAWDKHRNKEGGIVLMKDATTPPLIHFLPKFMEYYDFTEDDLATLTNGEANSLGEAWVNGKKITERDITCKNGYIHKVSGVIEPADNMVEYIRKQAVNGHDDPNGTSLWLEFLDRFAAPYYAGDNITNNYRRLYGTEDSVFVLRYFSNTTTTNPSGETERVRLAFDPGWNQYIYSNTSGYDMHYDAGMMIVPTNQALNEWFLNGAGKSLYEEFTTLQNVPDLTLIELLDVNMIESLTGKIPSKFADVLDPSTQESLGLDRRNEYQILDAHMGCNGVVFKVNKVFAPYSYSSVVFPAMVRERFFNTIYWGLDYEPTLDDTEPTLYFKPFLNSKLSHYSLLLPDNEAMLCYLDPVYYSKTSQSLLKFEYDEEEKTVKAKRFMATATPDGEISESGITGAKGIDVDEAVMKNRMRDMIENMVVVGEFVPGQEYYKTKSGSYIRVTNLTDNTATIQGAWQMQHNGKSLNVEKIYRQDNGETYHLTGQVPMTSTKSLYMTLKEHAEYKPFLDLVSGSDPQDEKSVLLSATMENTNGVTTGYSGNPDNYNFMLFDNYNYTVYVPDGEAIKKLVESNVLPTWDDFLEHSAIRDDRKNEYKPEEKKRASVYCEVIKERINDFIRYHVHDNSLIIGGPQGTADYETMKLNEQTHRFYTVTVSVDATSMSLKDALGNLVNVRTDLSGLYNNISRDYWFSGGVGTTGDYTRTILMDSDATIHLLDGVLRYMSDEELGSWEEEAEKRWYESLQGGGTEK